MPAEGRPAAALARADARVVARYESFTLVEAQGGDATALERITEVHRAPCIEDLPSRTTGRLERMDAGAIGRACVALGAGRAQASDAIDPAVGCSALAKVGGPVQRGEPLLRVHARDQQSLRGAISLLESAIEVS